MIYDITVRNSSIEVMIPLESGSILVYIIAFVIIKAFYSLMRSKRSLQAKPMFPILAYCKIDVTPPIREIKR